MSDQSDRSTEWQIKGVRPVRQKYKGQIKGVRPVGRPNRRWRDYCGAKGSGMDKDSKEQRKMEDSGGGPLPRMEGHSLQ